MAKDDIHPPRQPPTATIRARDTVDAAGQRTTSLDIFCPDCHAWTVVGGGSWSISAAVAAARDAHRRPMPDDDPSRVAIATIMSRHVLCARPEMSVEALGQLLLDEHIGGIPVVDRDNRLLGIVTKSDILRGGWEPAAWAVDDPKQRLASGYHAEPLPRAVAGEIMTPFVFTLPMDAPIARAAALMAHEGIHRLAVVAHDGTVVGMVTAFDVIRWMAQRAGYVVPDGRRAAVGTIDVIVPAAAGPVMIVDDDADLLGEYESVLGDEGYRVVTARNGVEAIERLAVATPAPSVIFLDLSMPVMDGWKFHAAITRDPSTAAIPIVLLSGQGDLRGEVSKLGADGYLTKPVAFDRLLGTVQQYVKA
jgi:CheY-like chemotaxis protein/predicted transcriptional regulator